MQQIATVMPLANMLLETDAPYLSPVPGQTNEPANLLLGVKKIATLKKTTPEIIAQTTTDNALTFLRLERTDDGLAKMISK